MAEDSLQTLEVPPPDPSTPRRVFLDVSGKDGLYPMMPHSMYCLPLWPGITLVLLTKVCGYQHISMFVLASSFCLNVNTIYSVIPNLQGAHLCYIRNYLINCSFMQCSQSPKYIIALLMSHLSIYIYLCQVPTSAVAMSVYTFLEAFAKLEKRLREGHEGSAATRGQPSIHDIRNKLDKFIKVLAPSEIQVWVFVCVVYQYFGINFFQSFVGRYVLLPPLN